MNSRHFLVGMLSLALIAFASFGCVKQDTPKAGEQAQAVTAKPQAPKYKAFGDSVQSAAAPIALAEAVKSLSDEKIVRVSAKVTEVCQAKGCWMMLTDGGSTAVRVTFKDYGFFVPKDLAGKTIIAEGLLTEEIVSEKQARHYAEDGGKSKAEIEKIKGEQKQLTMVAQSVFVPLN